MIKKTIALASLALISCTPTQTTDTLSLGLPVAPTMPDINTALVRLEQSGKPYFFFVETRPWHLYKEKISASHETFLIFSRSVGNYVRMETTFEPKRPESSIAYAIRISIGDIKTAPENGPIILFYNKGAGYTKPYKILITSNPSNECLSKLMSEIAIKISGGSDDPIGIETRAELNKCRFSSENIFDFISSISETMREK